MVEKQASDEQVNAIAYSDAEKDQVRQAMGDVLRSVTEPVAEPVGVYTAGAPGSGKSQNIVEGQRDRFADHGGIAEVDPDTIREVFPSAEREMASGGTTFSPEAYTASAVVSYQLCIELATDGRNILRDGTLASAEYTVPEIRRLKEEFSYSVEIHCAVPPPGLSWARTVARREVDARDSESGFGRGVDKSYHDSAVTGLRATAQQIYNEDLADRYALYDGRGALLLDRQRGEDGQMVTVVGHHADEVSLAKAIAHYQDNPTAQDLVDEAQAWSDALGNISPLRSEAERAEVARGWLAAAEHVKQTPAAKNLVPHGGELEKNIEQLTVRVLAVQSWYRDEAAARQAWPEGKELFDGLNAVAAQLRSKNAGSAADWRRVIRDEVIERGSAKVGAAEKEPPER